MLDEEVVVSCGLIVCWEVKEKKIKSQIFTLLEISRETREKGEKHMSVARNVKRSIVYLMIVAMAFCLIPLIGSVGQAHAASALQVNKIAVKPVKCDLAGKDAQTTIKATVTFNKKVTKANAQKLVSVTTSNKGSVSIGKKTFKVSKKTCTVSIKVKAVKDNCSAVIKVKAKKGKSAAKKGKSIKVSVYEPAESVFVAF